MSRWLAAALAVLVALGLLVFPAFAQTRQFTPAQWQILRSVMEPRGYVDQALHDKFWSEMTPESRASLQTAGIDGSVRQTVGVGMEFEREMWLSVQQTLARHEISYTTDYLLLLKRLSQRTNGRPSPFAPAVDMSKKLIAAAADGTAGPDGRKITPELVETQISTIEGNYRRIYALLSPTFPPASRDWPLPHARATVTWPFPFKLTQETVVAAGETGVASYVYDVGINASDFIALQTLMIDKTLDAGALMEEARLNFSRFKIFDPKGEAAEFRGHASVVIDGIVPPAFGKSYVSARAVQAADDNRLVFFVANSFVSAEDATRLRGELEAAVKFDDGF